MIEVWQSKVCNVSKTTYITQAKDEIYDDIVGVGETSQESLVDFIRCYNQMMYLDSDGYPMLINESNLSW